jgi:hypothetical protein
MRTGGPTVIANLPPDHPGMPTVFPEQLSRMRTELETYYRELPRLLDEGEEGRYLVVKGETAHGAWDTFRDARQHGGEVFGMTDFLAQVIDRRYLPVLERWFGPLPEASGGEAD